MWFIDWFYTWELSLYIIHITGWSAQLSYQGKSDIYKSVQWFSHTISKSHKYRKRYRTPRWYVIRDIHMFTGRAFKRNSTAINKHQRSKPLLNINKWSWNHAFPSKQYKIHGDLVNPRCKISSLLWRRLAWVIHHSYASYLSLLILTYKPWSLYWILLSFLPPLQVLSTSFLILLYPRNIFNNEIVCTYLITLKHQSDLNGWYVEKFNKHEDIYQVGLTITFIFNCVQNCALHCILATKHKFDADIQPHPKYPMKIFVSLTHSFFSSIKTLNGWTGAHYVNSLIFLNLYKCYKTYNPCRHPENLSSIEP